MGLSDDIHDAFFKLLNNYKKDYPNDQYLYKKEYKRMLFIMLKTLYTIQLPDYKAPIKIPSNEWIINHIEELLYNDDSY